MEIDHGAIGRRIGKCRPTLGLPQEIVSERADLTPAHYSHIERGNGGGQWRRNRKTA